MNTPLTPNSLIQIQIIRSSDGEKYIKCVPIHEIEQINKHVATGKTDIRLTSATIWLEIDTDYCTMESIQNKVNEAYANVTELK